VQLGAAADGQPGIIQGCTKLTRLSLSCDIMDAPEAVDGGVLVDCCLSNLVHLQHFRVVPFRHFKPSADLYDFKLPHLQHLKYVKLHCQFVNSLLQLSNLTSMQELHLFVSDEYLAGLTDLPSLVMPTALQSLVLLSNMEASLLSSVPSGLKHLRAEGDLQGPAEGPGSFLSCMARLQHLTSFVMAPRDGVLYGGVDWPFPCPQYSALTASSSLVRLQLHNPPGGIWQDVFPTTRTLPHLTSFSVAPHIDAPTEQPYWNQGDLVSLISCCPNLCSVDGISVQHGAHVSELRKLTALTRLYVHYDDQAVMLVGDTLNGLAQLTQLHSLRLVISAFDDLAPGRFLPLTSLTALTALELLHHDSDGRQQEAEFRTKVRSAQLSIVCMPVLRVLHHVDFSLLPHRRHRAQA
jgi:hypothetical protein